MRRVDRYIVAKMFLFIIEGIGVLLSVLYNPTSSERMADNWMEKTKEFGDEVNKWVED